MSMEFPLLCFKGYKEDQNNYFDAENKFEIAILTKRKKYEIFLMQELAIFFLLCAQIHSLPYRQTHIHIFIELFVINNYLTTYMHMNIVFYRTKSCQTYTNLIC